MSEWLKKIDIVLVKPQFPENIGAIARALVNMGLGKLIVVKPKRFWIEPMCRLASKLGVEVLANIRVYEELTEALFEYSMAIATTIRKGRNRGRFFTSRQIGSRIINWIDYGKVAFVFGPEHRGLTTREINICSSSMFIPTVAATSLNLAQAVVVLAYELRMQFLKDRKVKKAESKRLSMGEMNILHEHFKKALIAMDVILSENSDHFYIHLKKVLERANLSSREVQAVHGIARQGLWLANIVKKGSNL